MMFAPDQYWHPVLPAWQLRSKPQCVRFAFDHRVVLFRDEQGKIAALTDECPHRRAPLSAGRVENGRIVCPYHGWSFDREGEGSSPANPKMKPRTEAYDVEERYGLVWVRKRNERAQPVPAVVEPGYSTLFALRYSIAAPLLLVMDNFAEIEHSVETHLFLAHDEQGIRDTETNTTAGEDWVRVRNQGAQRKVNPILNLVMTYEEGDAFVGDGHLRFDPPRLELRNYWLNERSGKRRDADLAATVCFNPTSETTTDLLIVAHTRRSLWSPMAMLERAILTPMIHLETILDKRVIESIVGGRDDVTGLQLGRFDRALPLLRERLERLYLGARITGTAGNPRIHLPQVSA